VIRRYVSFIRFSHSVFALPFALVGALFAARIVPVGWRQVVWIVVAMVAARSAAMGFNRLVDVEFDARNPRTAMRELPQGLITRPAATAFVVVASVVFVLAAGQLSTLCLALSPVALAIVFWYSLAKRYTAYTQAFLGLAMAVAPVGGWLAAGSHGSLVSRSACGSADSTSSTRVRTSSSIAPTAFDRSRCASGSRARS
jgi:4-hydroxybenzoate polyprenyltransferase